MRALLTAIAISIPLAACASSPPAGAPGAAPSATAEIALNPPASASSSAAIPDGAIRPDPPSVVLFRRAWAEVLPTLKPDHRAWGQEMDALIREPHAPIEQRAEVCRARRAFLRKNLSALLDKLVLRGSVDKLDREGTCPIVFVAGGMHREVEAVLDPSGAEILLMWLVPEG